MRCLRRRKKTPKPEPEFNPIIVEGTLLDIQVHGLANFGKEEKDFFIEVMKLKLVIISSEEFKQRFVNMSATEKGNKTMLQIYNELISGKEKYNKQVDHDIDLFITLYGHSSRRSKTVGYTYPSTFKLWTNKYFFRRWMNQKYGKASAAGHWVHEYFHNLGYDHRGRKSTSLVYKAGYLVRDLGREVIDGRELTPIYRPK